MTLRGALSTLVFAGSQLVAACALAAPPNGCLDLYDPARKGGAENVYVSVERSDEAAVCFLIPRQVVPVRFRSTYSDGVAAPMLIFDPHDLLAYIDGKKSVMVGAERRDAETAAHDCQEHPMFDSIEIASGFKFKPLDVETISTFSKEIVSDLPGYRLLTTEVQDYYIAEAPADSRVPVACWRKQHPHRCFILGDYDKATLALEFQKGELVRMSTAKTLECIRDIADLFRVRKPVGAE
jgi:hypothetical protein